ncbi:sigma-70 family RNA polymerase sigma factor [Fervidibacillus halotolerans]|uniref:Sigma-70 family RNA polymerase sigma factor n=1 Tax=Fervidibacillus halotolerans TaxID=2980027 RepID=A0A9E8M1I0_9BACI|nr:sigma-70 family RNA polymerase sigma factor [Fervidibacillus halotolerans]WAA12564.1 sigma-70 family RNA polymerase sigma factor [Fervidibacillus halotolerans]
MAEKAESVGHFNLLTKDESIEQIMDTYGEELKRFIFTYVKNRSQTDDIFQEVLLTVYRRLDTLKDSRSLKNWLYKITANKCKDYLRSPIHRLIVWKEEITENTNDTPERAVVMSERKRELIEAILKLPIKYREVLILQYYKEFSIKEISELLNVNPSTVKTRIMRAKEKLRQNMRGDIFDD